jgi:hypothetical protein
MNDQIEAVIKEVEKFNESIKDSLNSKNISNSGEASKSLFVEFGENFVQSIGAFYLEFLDTGRAPGKFPPIKPLKDWAKIKFGADDEEAESIAFAVAHKIKRLGTEIFINNGKGIELDKKIVTLRENLNVAVRESTVLEIKQRLRKFKDIAIKQKYHI